MENTCKIRVDGAVGTMAYQGGKEPAAAFWDMTAAYDNPLHLLMWYRQGGGVEILNKIAAKWDGVFLGPVMLGLESIPSKKPIRSIVVTIYDVVCDVVFQSPTVWVYAVVTTAIAVAFLIGGSYALMRREHIRITAVYDRFSRLTRLRCRSQACSSCSFYPTWRCCCHGCCIRD